MSVPPLGVLALTAVIAGSVAGLPDAENPVVHVQSRWRGSLTRYAFRRTRNILRMQIDRLQYVMRSILRTLDPENYTEREREARASVDQTIDSMRPREYSIVRADRLGAIRRRLN